MQSGSKTFLRVLKIGKYVWIKLKFRKYISIYLKYVIKKNFQKIFKNKKV